MALFRYAPEIVEQFPGIVGGVIHATGVTNGPTPSGLAAAFSATQADVRAQIGETPLSELTALAAWRRAFRAFGVDPTQYRSAAEALLRRLIKQGELPSIGTLVDIANLVSIRHALPVAVFDLQAVSVPGSPTSVIPHAGALRLRGTRAAVSSKFGVRSDIRPTQAPRCPGSRHDVALHELGEAQRAPVADV